MARKAQSHGTYIIIYNYMYNYMPCTRCLLYDNENAQSITRLLFSSGHPYTHGTCASLLKAKLFEHVREPRVVAQLGQLNVHTSPEPSAQVGGAGENVAEMFIPHKLMA